VPVAEETQAGADRRGPAAPVDHRQPQRLPAECLCRADTREEAPVGREAAERDVLAVVGRRRGIALALGERLHGTAERRPGLVKDDLVTRVDELERRREPGEAAADDGDAASSQRNEPATIRSFVGSDRRGGPSKTS
jgi:hypothetical protein